MLGAIRRVGVLLATVVVTAGLAIPAGAGPGSGKNPPPPPGPPQLASVTFSPSSVAGGAPSTGTVTFSSVTDGASVSLASSNPAVVGVPAEMVVNGGASRGTFPVTTTAVTTSQTITVTATWLGQTKTGSIIVSPGAPPAADTVRITRAEWKQGLLRIEATSTNPNAILNVHLTVNDSFMFTLTNNGGGKFSDQRGFVENPRNITVHSNFGGSATAAT